MVASKLPQTAWVIFDADNTIWHVEHLYDAARHALVDLLSRYDVTPSSVETYQRAKDIVLFELYRYAPVRFEMSFVETLYHFLPEEAVGLELKVRELARKVFDGDALICPDVPIAVNMLKKRFRLAILTAGDYSIQTQRLEKFPYKRGFDTIEIVDCKSRLIFQEFSERHGINISASYVVGDSLRSDILPALEAGLKPIWFCSKNWYEVENQKNVPRNIPVVANLSEAAKVILKDSNQASSLRSELYQPIIVPVNRIT